MDALLVPALNNKGFLQAEGKLSQKEIKHKKLICEFYLNTAGKTKNKIQLKRSIQLKNAGSNMKKLEMNIDYTKQ